MEKAKVTPTPDLEKAMLDIFVRSCRSSRAAGKLGALLLQLSPAFSPRKHKLEELDQLIGMLGDYRLAIEFRNRNWAIGDQLDATIDFLRVSTHRGFRKCRYHGVWIISPSCPRIMDEITSPGRCLSEIAWTKCSVPTSRERLWLRVSITITTMTKSPR